MKRGILPQFTFLRLLFGLSWLFSTAFTTNAQTIDYDNAIPATWLRGAELRLGNPDIDGTPYLFKDWQPGTMLMTNGRLVEDIKVNFINQAGEVMVSKPYAGLNVQYGVIELDVVSVTISEKDEDRRFVRYWADTIENVGDEQHYFYEVLAEGKVSLLKKPYKFYKRPKQREAYSSGNTKAKYVPKSDFFMRLPGQENYTQVRLSKGILLKAIDPAYREKAKATMKQMKGKWTREKDVAAMLLSLFH